MDTLEQLYAKLKVFTDYGSNIPDQLLREIAEAEAELLSNASDIIVSYLPEEIDAPTLNKLVIGAEYADGKLVRVATSTDCTLADIFNHVRDIVPEEEEDEVSTVNERYNDRDSDRKRGPKIGFSVKFADGKEIKCNTAQQTMIEALRYMGLERASKYRGETFKGYPLIGKEQRPAEHRRPWQKYVDGWWIYINLSSARAITCIKDVAAMLNIPIEIKRDEELPEPLPTKFQGRRAMFSLNGGEPACKNRTVWNAVSYLLKELPTATFKDVSDLFPKALQGSYGVVATVDEIEERNKYNHTEYSRWFNDPEEILTSADGIRFAVSNEWGHNFDNFRAHVIREFGWAITEV